MVKGIGVRHTYLFIHENDPDMTRVDDISEQQAIEMVGRYFHKIK